VVAARFEKGDVRVNAAVADGQPVFVAEDHLVAFAMTGADQRRRGKADAHARPSAGEIAVPGVAEIAPDGEGNFLLLQVGPGGKRFCERPRCISSRPAGVELGAGGVVDGTRRDRSALCVPKSVSVKVEAGQPVAGCRPRHCSQASA